MENRKHLPMLGVGPAYVAVIIAVTVIAVIAGKITAFETGRQLPASMNIFFLPLFFFLLDIYDCSDEMHRGKVAEKFVRKGI